MDSVNCRYCEADGVFHQYAYEATSPRVCDSSGYWTPEEATGQYFSLVTHGPVWLRLVAHATCNIRVVGSIPDEATTKQNLCMHLCKYIWIKVSDKSHIL